MGKRKEARRPTQRDSERRVRATLEPETYAFWAPFVGPGKPYYNWAALLETVLREEQARRSRRS